MLSIPMYGQSCTVNKRLDDWVGEDRLDIEKLQLPRKDSKVSTLSKSSRPASPDVVMPLLSSDPKKYNSISGNRKRKHDSVEVQHVDDVCDYMYVATSLSRLVLYFHICISHTHTHTHSHTHTHTHTAGIC